MPFRPTMEVIDCHTHFGDPAQPKQIFRTELPPAYKVLACAEGVTGTVVVESTRRAESPKAETPAECQVAGWEENTWTLALADRDPSFIHGLVGDLDPFSDGFDAELAHFAQDERFVGYRLSTFPQDASNPEPGERAYAGHPSFEADCVNARLVKSLRATAAAGLVLDVHCGLSPDCRASFNSESFLTEVIKQVPDLRVVINHAGNCRPIDPQTGDPPSSWTDCMHRIATLSPNIYMKVSALVQMQPCLVCGGPACQTNDHPLPSSDPRRFFPIMNVLWDCFGPSRLIYASNWPQVEARSSFEVEHRCKVAFFKTKSEEAERQFFAGNARRLYRWGEPKTPVAAAAALL